ncbi:uncharacterized protein LOC133883582 [Phragmites australis]|uniref:uncharacterized protein LOC133883582 n=1 Tax=Phragmites australis TaxID=29695 RepID=UPI002D793C1B|nr:uncharacterized protein LOC133883582 [Phragmites australis]
MRRRRRARAATAPCLAIVVVLLLALDIVAADGRPLSSKRAHGHAHVHRERGLPPSTTTASLPVHRAVARAEGDRATVDFGAATTGAQCKSLKQNTRGVGGQGTACVDDDDDKRRVPTGPNPLHNR